MIPAEKSAWLSRYLAGDARRRIWRSFGVVRVRGLAVLEEAVRRGPVLVVSNHTSWWDPLVLQWLCHVVLRVDAYAMMDAKNLVRLPFFRKVGAFGVDLDDAADGVRAMRYATRLLDRPGRLVWIFPQGAETPITKRPLVFRPGAAVIARAAANATVVPVALRYEMSGEPHPHLWIAVGAPIPRAVERGAAARRATLTAQEDAVMVAMETIAHAIHGGSDAGFVQVHAQSPGLFFRLAQAALVWLTRPRARLAEDGGGVDEPTTATDPE